MKWIFNNITNECNQLQCYKLKVLHITYPTLIIVNQEEKARGREGEGVRQARAEEKALRR